MQPILVDSTQCHLWTDALHVRQLARETPNRWDRGTYVRLTIVLAWTSLEIACQDALGAPEIGYRFKENLDQALLTAGFAALDWSQGVWQEARRLQELRKSVVHKFANLTEMFPDEGVADQAISSARSAIASIYVHTGQTKPGWIEFDGALGWSGRSGVSDSTSATLTTGGASLDDPTSVRIYLVRNGVEELSSVHPKGTDYGPEVIRLVQSVRVPISGVRVYEGKTLFRELLVNMRGNS